MAFFSCLRSYTPSRSPRGRAHRSAAARFQPRLEALEDRCVPSTLKHHSPPPPAPTLTVINTGDSGPGSLRYEIAAANPGDTITFAPSLDNQTINLSSGQLSINKNLNIQSPGAGLLAIRPATHANVISYPRIFDVAANVTLNLSGLTLENGGGTAWGSYYGNSGFPSPDPWDAYGGAILNFGALTVSGCSLLNNSVLPAGSASHAMYGGAIYNAGTLTLTDSTLSGNAACLFSASSYVGRGGAIYNGGTASISGCTLTGNTAGDGYSLGQGGAIFNAGPLSLSGCTVSGNSASSGGGIFNRTSAASAVTLSNDTLKSNAATTAGGAGSGLGGGLYVDYGTVTLTNDTVQSNTAANDGGGIYIASGAVVHLDGVTLAHVINNTAHKHKNIDGSFLTP